LKILLHYILVSSEERAKFARRLPVRARTRTQSKYQGQQARSFLM